MSNKSKQPKQSEPAKQKQRMEQPKRAKQLEQASPPKQQEQQEQPQQSAISPKRSALLPPAALDKRPLRAPRRPDAARFESGRRTGAKKRLGGKGK